MRFFEAIDSINEHVGRVLAYLGAAMMFIVAYEVVVRYIFNHPTIWALEINQSLLCIYVALAGGYTLLHKGHVNVEIVYARLGMRTRMILDILTSFLFFGFVIVLLWQTWDMAWVSLMIGEHSESLLGLPLYPAKIAIVIGALLILLQGVANISRNVKALITGVEPPKPSDIFDEQEK